MKKIDERDTIEKGWEPDHKPDEVNINIDEADYTEIVITTGLEQPAEILEPASNKEEIESDDHPSPEEENDVKESLSAEDKKRIGYWGEKVVFNALRKEYLHKNNDLSETDSGFKLIDPNGNEIEIVWLNMKHDVGKGYDLLKRENRTVVEYLEVKTKLGSHEELIKITGKQWESVRTLYDRGEGEKYSIYVVSNAGQQTAKITKLNDPIRLWKEGKLYAHPVNFKL